MQFSAEFIIYVVMHFSTKVITYVVMQFSAEVITYVVMQFIQFYNFTIIQFTIFIKKYNKLTFGFMAN